MSTVNSGLGPIESDTLGFTLIHEHVMIAPSGMSRHYPDLLGPTEKSGRSRA